MEMISEEKKLFFNDSLKLLTTFSDICDREGIWYSLAFGTLLGAIRHNGFIPWDYDADVMIYISDKDKYRNAFKNAGILELAIRNCDEEGIMQNHDILHFEDYRNHSATLDIYFIIGASNDRKKGGRFAVIVHNMDKVIRSKYNRLKDCRRKNIPLVFMAKIIDWLFPDKVLKLFTYKYQSKYSVESSKYLIVSSGYGKKEECMNREVFKNTMLHTFENKSFKIIREYDTYLRNVYGDYMKPQIM